MMLEVKLGFLHGLGKRMVWFEIVPALANRVRSDRHPLIQSSDLQSVYQCFRGHIPDANDFVLSTQGLSVCSEVTMMRQCVE